MYNIFITPSLSYYQPLTYILLIELILFNFQRELQHVVQKLLAVQEVHMEVHSMEVHNTEVHSTEVHTIVVHMVTHLQDYIQINIIIIQSGQTWIFGYALKWTNHVSTYRNTSTLFDVFMAWRYVIGSFKRQIKYS